MCNLRCMASIDDLVISTRLYWSLLGSVLLIQSQAQVYPDHFDEDWLFFDEAPHALINLHKDLEFKSIHINDSVYHEVDFDFTLEHINDSVVRLRSHRPSSFKRFTRYYARDKGSYHLSNRRGKVKTPKENKPLYVPEQTACSYSDTVRSELGYIITRFRCWNCNEDSSRFELRVQEYQEGELVRQEVTNQQFEYSKNETVYKFYENIDSTRSVVVDSSYCRDTYKYETTRAETDYFYNNSGQLIRRESKVSYSRPNRDPRKYITEFSYKDGLCIRVDQYYDNGYHGITKITFLDNPE